MKCSLLVAILLALPFYGLAQTYISFAPSLTNEIGNLAQKSNMALELGRQWDVFSVGLAAGKTNLGKIGGRDTTAYLEIRPDLNIFQQGKFTNTLTPGIGYIFNTGQYLMFELTSGIEYSYTPLIHFNIVFGQYYYSGLVATSTVNFFGISVMKYFSPVKSRSLINPKP